MLLHCDSYPCEVNDTGHALVTLSRCEWITGYGWKQGRLWWEVDQHDVPRAELACRHMKIAEHVQRAISSHKAVEWKP